MGEEQIPFTRSLQEHCHIHFPFPKQIRCLEHCDIWSVQLALHLQLMWSVDTKIKMGKRWESGGKMSKQTVKLMGVVLGWNGVDVMSVERIAIARQREWYPTRIRRCVQVEIWREMGEMRGKPDRNKLTANLSMLPMFPIQFHSKSKATRELHAGVRDGHVWGLKVSIN